MGKRDNADVDETDCEMFLKSVPCKRFLLVRLFDGEREREEREVELLTRRWNTKGNGRKGEWNTFTDTEGKFLFQGICS